MSTALPKEKVEQAINRLRPELRRLARRWFHRTWNGSPFYRHGSDAFARKYPEMEVTPEQRALMFELQQEGCSYREIEEIMHLYPNSGNDAYRCVKQHEALMARGLAPQPRIKRKSRATIGQLKKMAATFVPRTEKEQAEYLSIISIINNNGKKRKRPQHQETQPEQEAAV